MYFCFLNLFPKINLMLAIKKIFILKNKTDFCKSAAIDYLRFIFIKNFDTTLFQNHMLHHLINLVFPKICAGCKGVLLEAEQTICVSCRHKMPVTNHFIDFENDAFKIFYGRLDVAFVAALFYFQKQSLVQEMIYSLKYRGNQKVGNILGLWVGAKLKCLEICKTFDYIIPVPLHQRKYRKRGYNQLTTFGMALSETIFVAYDDSILKRNIYSQSQTKKSLNNRNVLQSAIFEATFDESHHNKHFLIIDDVLTTGATIEGCAKALQKIPGTKISVVCMAYTH